MFDLSEKVTEMGKFKYSIILASALVVSPLATAIAADLNPEPIPVPAPVPVSSCCEGAWYLKGFVGFSNQQADEFTNDFIEIGNFTIVSNEFDSAPFVGLGIGYEHSDRFRFDLTGEYRGRASFQGLDYNNATAPIQTNEYRGFKSEWLFLASAYWDIATFRGITPYVGAGVGVAEISLDNFQDANQVAAGLHWADDGSEWNFAWALHAGLAFDVTNSLTLDVGYRYVSLGDGVTGNFTSYDPTVTSPGPLTIKDIDSHDVMVGLRWRWDHSDACCETAQYVPQTYPSAYK